MNLYCLGLMAGWVSQADFFGVMIILLQFHYCFNHLKECVCNKIQPLQAVIMASPSVREGWNKCHI